MKERRDEAGHAIAILDATVRSLSSFALFFSNACCRQLSRFWQLWCSGMRCYKARPVRQWNQDVRNWRRTVPQNSARQCGHEPTMRSAAWLQRASASN